jgi:hypothetical protein
VTSASAPPWQRAYLVTCCAIIAGAVAYWLPHWAQLPIWSYLPVERRWTFDPPSSAVVISYFGLLLWGVAGVVVGTIAGVGLARIINRPLSVSALRLVGAWAITAFVLTGWYYTWNLWPF